MVNLAGVRHVSSYLLEVGVQTTSEIKHGFLTFFSSDGAYMLWKIYSMDGFEKWTKALLAQLEFIALFPAVNSIFAKCKATIESEKDLYYASLTFGVFALLVKKDDQGNAIGFQLPQLKAEDGGGIDWSMLSLCIAAFLDTAQFCKKYDVLEFAFYSKTIGPLGGYCHLNKIPVVQSLFDGRPKEFFIVTSSIIDCTRALRRGWKLWNIPIDQRSNFWTMEKWETLFQIGGSMGKIIGISCYRKYGGRTWLAIVGLIGTHSSLFKFMLSHHLKRLKRNEYPDRPEI